MSRDSLLAALVLCLPIIEDPSSLTRSLEEKNPQWKDKNSSIILKLPSSDLVLVLISRATTTLVWQSQLGKEKWVKNLPPTWVRDQYDWLCLYLTVVLPYHNNSLFCITTWVLNHAHCNGHCCRKTLVVMTIRHRRCQSKLYSQCAHIYCTSYCLLRVHVN